MGNLEHLKKVLKLESFRVKRSFWMFVMIVALRQ